MMLFIRRNFLLMISCTYSKWLKRRAVRVLTSAESDCFHSSRRKSPATKPNVNSSTAGNTLVSDVIDSNNVQFETIHMGDARFGPVITDAKSLTGRERRKIILLEGRRLVMEAAQTSQPLKSIFFTDAEVLEGLPVQSLTESGVKFYRVKKDHMNLWSDTVTPQGIMAICRLRNHAKSRQMNLLPLTLICDSIKDPGTLGTLIRSAVAACCKKVLVTKGCVDVWEPKVIRSGAGAHFHSHSLVTQVTWQQVGNYFESEDTELLLVNCLSAGDVRQMTNSKRRKDKTNVVIDLPELSSVKLDMINCASATDMVLLVSGGLTTDAYRFAASHNGRLISFPVTDSRSGTNAAVSGSVALFEIVRQLRLNSANASDTAS